MYLYFEPTSLFRESEEQSWISGRKLIPGSNVRQREIESLAKTPTWLRLGVKIRADGILGD